MAKQLKGDINNDGKITSLDLYICFSYQTQEVDLSEQEQARADINGDGDISLADARKILQHISGTELIDGVIE